MPYPTIEEVDQNGNPINGGNTAGGIVDGADVNQGSTTDAAVTSDANGTVSAKLRGLVKMVSDVWSGSNHWITVNLGSLIAGEDLTNNVLKVEQRFSYANILTATTTTVKSGAGFLHTITFNKPIASEVWTLYDNTAGSGTKIGTITLPATLLQQGPYTATYNVSFVTGLTIVSGSTTDGTVSYR